jgi:UTP:GlnB (protein PII) uridylyltransferase
MTTASVDAAVPVLERASPGLVQELKSYVVRHRGEVEAMIRAGGPDAGDVASQRFAKVFDGLLCSLFHATQATLTREGAWRQVALAAVGSYGRSTLAFASDLDVRILC